MRLLLVLVAVVLLSSTTSAAVRPLTPPLADFTWSPQYARAGEEVTFVSQSVSPSAIVVLRRWYVEPADEATPRLGETTVQAFPRAGAYNVTHEVTDALLQQARVTRTVLIANTPPVLSIAVNASPTYRGVPVSFLGAFTDVDGDALVNWTWSFGDGAMAHGQNATHAYHALGVYDVRLDGIDEPGDVASAFAKVRVVNAPPYATGAFTPSHPRVDEVVTFSGFAVDRDSHDDEFEFVWTFSDGTTLAGAQVSRTFAHAGEHHATLRARDSEGAWSAPHMLVVPVDP